MSHPPVLDRARLSLRVLGLMTAGVLVMGAMFFLPAGTFAYWEAWVYLGVLFVPMSVAMIYFLVASPQTLVRRMRVREKEVEQQRIIKTGTVILLLAFLVPGFDHRFGWSSVPVWVVLTADVVVFASYSFLFWVMRENPWAGRTVEVEPGQPVISTGPYRIVRHPMYVAALLLYSVSPLALGSWWGALVSILVVIMLVLRIRNEERVLLRDLPGYRHYTEKVPWRLIPYVW